MNRNEWLALYRRMRAGNRFASSEIIHHGGTYWSAHYFVSGSDKGLHIRPSCIVDRMVPARCAESLYWARRYRLEAKAYRSWGSSRALHAIASIAGAKACIAESRAIRASALTYCELVRHPSGYPQIVGDGRNMPVLFGWADPVTS